MVGCLAFGNVGYVPEIIEEAYFFNEYSHLRIFKNNLAIISASYYRYSKVFSDIPKKSLLISRNVHSVPLVSA